MDRPPPAEPPAAPAAAGRRLGLGSVLGLVGAVAALLADRPALERRALGASAGWALAELAEQGGLVDLRELGGQVDVEVVADDPLVGDALGRAAERSPDLRPAPSRHVLRGELVREGPWLGLTVRLFRRGWELRSPRPRWRLVAPWAFGIPAAAAGLLAVATRRVVACLALAAVAVQLWLAALEPPAQALLGRPGPLRGATTGPLVDALRWADGPSLYAAGAAVVALCGVLAALDHRRDPRAIPGGQAVALALLGGLAGLGLVEGALRSGWAAAVASSLPGAGAGLAVAWLWALATWPRERLGPARSRLAGLLAVGAVGVAGAVGCGEGTRGADPQLGPARRPAPVASVSEADAWLDLIAQRPNAVEYTMGRLWIDLGRLSAQRHLDPSTSSNWQLQRPVDERFAAVIRGRSASLSVPLDGPLSPRAHPDDEEGRPGLAIALTLKPLAENQRMTVLLNERVLANLTLEAGWQRRTLSLPADAIGPGENRIRLHFRHTERRDDEEVSAAVESIEVGPRAVIVAGPPTVAGYATRPDSDGTTTLAIAANTSLAWYAVAPRRARLRVHVAGSGRASISISTDDDHRGGPGAGPPVRVLRELELANVPGPLDLDLSGWANLPIRVELGLTGQPTDAMTIRELRLDSPRARPADRRARGPRDVVVFAVEGLRADELYARRFDGAQLPAMWSLVDSGLAFERAYAAGAAAVPSHAAILTSILPSQHLTTRGTFVAASRIKLVELFERAGYRPFVITANRDLGSERGLTPSGAAVVALERGPTRGNDAGAVVRAALSQWAAREAPRFAYLNFSDPQAPYDPPREFGELKTPPGAPAPHMTHIWVGKVQTGQLPTHDHEGTPLVDHTAWVRSLYRLELEAVDAAIGQVLAALDRDGALERTLIVLVGIHGEEFREHGGAGHGRTLFEESVRVPLVLRCPPLVAPGRVEVPVDLLDLAPTLADLLGLEPPVSWQGSSLIPIVDDPHPPLRAALAQLGDGSRALWFDRYKLIHGPGQGPAAVRLFDLRADPAERGEGAFTRGIALRLAISALSWQQRFEAKWRRTRWGTGVNLAPAFAVDHGM